MPQIDLMRAAGETVQDNEHGTGVLRAHLSELLLGEVPRSRRQGGVGFLGRLDDEVDGEAAVELDPVGLEDAPLVVDGRPVGLGRRPHGLQVPVEEQRVEIARRHSVPAYLEEIGRLPIPCL